MAILVATEDVETKDRKGEGMDGVNAGGKGKRYILVMDGNVDDRFHMSMLLQRFGYNTCTVGTIDEAVEFMHVAPPVAIVAEGGITGNSVLSRLKKNSSFTDVPLLLLSSSPAGLQGRVNAGEIAAALKKPVDAEELYQVIQAVVEKTPRKHIRIATSLRARLEDNGTEGLVTVLSELGLFFRTLDPRPANTRLPLTLLVKDKSLQVEALVLYCTSFDQGPFKEPGMGMKFVKISPGDQSFLKNFILEQVEQGIPRTGEGRQQIGGGQQW